MTARALLMLIMAARFPPLVGRMEQGSGDDERAVLEFIATFNEVMLGNVDGPDCIALGTCKDNCCGIMIDVPDVLARTYVERGLLGPGGVRRGDTFAWKLGTRDDTGRCVFYDPVSRGCTIYVKDLATRPPQCAIYPAGYTTGAAACKGGAGPWRVRDVTTGEACERGMQAYASWCLREREAIRASLATTIGARITASIERATPAPPPSAIAGIMDTWDGHAILPAEGRSLAFKRFCTGCDAGFLECKAACPAALERFAGFMTGGIGRCLRDPDGLRETYTIVGLDWVTS